MLIPKTQSHSQLDVCPREMQYSNSVTFVNGELFKLHQTEGGTNANIGAISLRGPNEDFIQECVR